MKERPILFSGPMVRAILEGRKTQTRRVVAYQEDLRDEVDGGCLYIHAAGCEGHCDYSCTKAEFLGLGGKGWNNLPLCPYGQPGDRLWVRESWCPGVPGVTTLAGKTYGVRPFPKSWPIPKTRPEGLVVKYAASWEDDGPPPMRPSIHMPRWASRITLEVTEVRVQRLQDITEADAIAEGSQQPEVARITGACFSERDVYAKLWDSINSQRHGCDWASNPWVWAVSFGRAKP